MEENNRRLSQPARKSIERIDKNGNVVDEWDSVRQMCKILQYDRRAVIRVLKGEPKYKSVRKYTFKYK